MSRESNLTRLWLKWVESESSRPWKSTIWVESEWSHADRHLSQSWAGYCLSQSWVTDFSKRKRQDLAIIYNLTEKEPTYSYIRPPPLRSTTFFPKLGKIWWVVTRESDLTQLWLKWVESELSQVSNFGFWVESELSQVSNFGIWVESELSHLDCHMSQSRVNPKKWVEHNPDSDVTHSWSIMTWDLLFDTRFGIVARRGITSFVSLSALVSDIF